MSRPLPTEDNKKSQETLVSMLRVVLEQKTMEQIPPWEANMLSGSLEFPCIVSYPKPASYSYSEPGPSGSCPLISLL